MKEDEGKEKKYFCLRVEKNADKKSYVMSRVDVMIMMMIFTSSGVRLEGSV
jgi:hypothetical protein